MEEQKIKYIMPDFYNYSINEFYIKLFKKYTNVLKDKVSYYSFYGTFPNCIWNGGSYCFADTNISLKEMKKVRNFYNSNGIAITFTFTNQLITEKYLLDEYSNQMLEIFHNGMNEVLIVSPILEDYIRKKYPKYKINRSIISTEHIPLICENYHLSVLSKFKNKDFEFLNKLGIEERKKTEILCAEGCINNCPYAYQHYKEYAYIQLHGRKPVNASYKYGECRFDENSWEFFKKRLYGSHYRISYLDIIETYMPMGFQYFKLSGRGRRNFVALLKNQEYLIKDEYQNDVLIFLLERMMLEHYEEHNGWLRKN